MELSEIIGQFSDEPIDKRITTLPEIFGFQYKETYITKWLAYLLSPDNGFDTEPLNALLSLYQEDIECVGSTDDIEVLPEYRFNDNRIIDILIRTDSYLIGIENKLWSSEQYEQTNDYYCSIVQKCEEENRKPICVFLKPEANNTICECANFKIITYSQLCNALKEIPYDTKRSQRENLFFYEFIYYVEETLMCNSGFPEISLNVKTYMENQILITETEKKYKGTLEQAISWLAAKLNDLSTGEYCFSSKGNDYVQIVKNEEWKKLDFHFELLWTSSVTLIPQKINLCAHLEKNGNKNYSETENAFRSTKMQRGKNRYSYSEPVNVDFTSEEKAVESLNKIIDMLNSSNFCVLAELADKLCYEISQR